MPNQPTVTPAEFAARWRGVTTTEKASAQAHFIDLCRMLGEPTPHEADPTGESYAFEKAVQNEQPWNETAANSSTSSVRTSNLPPLVRGSAM